MNSRSFVIGSSLALVFLLAWSPSLFSAAASPINLTRDQNGLVAQDTLSASMNQQQLLSQSSNAGLWSYGGHYGSSLLHYSNQAWTYGGSHNAEAQFNESSSGLSISIKAAGSGAYTGLYANSQPSDADLYHAIVTSPYTTIESGFLQIGLYVRASIGNVNYVTCTAATGANGTRWEIIHGTGNSVEATNFDYLWIAAPSSQLTRDCTIITNGGNYLAVYLDHSLVYENNTLSLGIQKPFEGFLEIESTDSNQSLTGMWSDFYSSLGNAVTVNNIPSSSASVSIMSPSGNTLVSSSVEDGSASLDIAQYQIPLQGTIVVLASNGTTIASSVLVNLAGGDTYTGKTTLHQQVSSVLDFLSGPALLLLLVPSAALIVAVTAYGVTRSKRKRTTLEEVD